MAFSNNPLTVPRDAVYILLGLTDPTQELLSDSEVDYFLGVTNNDTVFAAVKAGRSILFKLSQNSRSRFDNMEVFDNQVYEQFKTALMTFIDSNDPESSRRSAAIAVSKAQGYAGNISNSDILVNNTNLDNHVIVPPRDFQTFPYDRTKNPFVI